MAISFMLMAASPRYFDMFTGAAVVMGVASSGKTTLGEALAKRLRVTFVEGDALHSPENVVKMSQGIALTDEDRWPWLQRVGSNLKGPQGCIASCSALKRIYRQCIMEAAARPVSFVHLFGAKEVLESRIAHRKGHFMPASLLDSQLATLEMPGPDEHAIAIDITNSVEAQVEQAVQFLLASG
jgi:gluconokinase